VGVEEAHVEVRMASGQRYTKHVPHLRGSLQCPMSDAELEAKFVDQTTLSVPGFDAVQAIEALWRLESLDDVAVLARLLTADGG
jgi:hypothetical protein